mgnify:CR=1 FL=1
MRTSRLRPVARVACALLVSAGLFAQAAPPPGQAPAVTLDGYPAPGTYKEFVKLASIKEIDGVPPALDMVSHLVSAQEATARTARRLFPLLEKANDQPTADLITQRLDLHEKTAWMLRSLLEE